MKRIIYWDTGKSSFVLKDLAILRTEFKVTDNSFLVKKKVWLPAYLLWQLVISLFQIPFCSVVICQFAGYHSLMPFLIARLFNKPRVIIAGGTDCVAFYSMNYGNFSRKYLRWFTRKSFEWSTLILPVTQALIKQNYNYLSNDIDPKEQGYRAFVKKITAREVVIYNGYDPKIWHPKQGVERVKNSFITVGANLHSRFAFQLKGIDLFIELANNYPTCTFAILGGEGLQLNSKPENLTLLPNQKNELLPELYSQFEYYVQLSVSEGFPNALTEAIFCGCRPIVSGVGGMPEIVMDKSMILGKKILNDLFSIVDKAISITDNSEQRINEVRERFSIELRRQKLLEEIRNAIDADK